jgi:branched-chain amino acid transport system ATP-binding protein
VVAVAALSAPLLETVGLQRTFGGLVAVRGVDFRLDRGEIRAIIGPNGAGKTTLLNLICGRLRPTAGRVLYHGADITQLPAHARGGRGIVYTFQIVSIYRNLTVEENVGLAARRLLMQGPLHHFAVNARAVAERVHSALYQVGLAAARDRLAGYLPYGHQRLLEIAMALAAAPHVLALDEPTQGLAPDEIASLVALIRDVAQSVTILLVEHNMQVVLGLSQRITVMDQGRIIAEGTPAEIEANPGVQRVYLGG